MKKMTLVCAFLFITLGGSVVASTNHVSADQRVIEQSHTSTPLAFTKNMGQWPDSILFRTTSNGATLWFTKNGIWYQFFRKIEKARASATEIDSEQGAFEDMPAKFGHERDRIETMMIKAEFVGANPESEVIEDGAVEYKCNYFIGNEPSKWRTDVPSFSTVTIKGIYPEIDVRFSSDANNQATYEFVTTPVANLSQVKVAYEGAETMPNADGKLVVNSVWGKMVEAMMLPQEHAGAAILVKSCSERSISVGLSATSDASSPNTGVGLVYSTYLGGNFHDIGYGIAVDASGNAILTGTTFSTNFPTLVPYQTGLGGGAQDIFVTKLSSSGSSLIYSTYLGGDGFDEALGVVVDSSGNAFVTGETSSSNFPTVNSYQTSAGSVDAFVIKMSSSGNALVYSTYLGGESPDVGYAIDVDASGNAFVTGQTQSVDFPTVNPFQSEQVEIDAFVTKLSTSGNSLVYSTLLSGGRDDVGYGIAVDASGNAYVIGDTYSTDFPTSNPFQTDSGDGVSDVFVVKLSGSGDALVYSTYLGGGGEDHGRGIEVDDSGNVFVTGNTNSTNFPTLNPFQIDPGDGNWDVFVTKFSNSGSILLYSTYLGGGRSDIGYGIAINSEGNAFVSGATLSDNYPVVSYYQTDPVDFASDVFITKLSSGGNFPVFSTYLGGNSLDVGYSIDIDTSGAVYVTGNTFSMNFPTLNPYQNDPGDVSFDAFVTKLESPCCNLAGDADGDASVSIADAVYLIQYIFAGGPASPCHAEGDADADALITIGDVVYLIQYIFNSGPAPECGAP